MKFGIGQAVPRTEDARLLTGGGRYTDDVSLPGQAYAAFVRSPHAFAAIGAIDSSEALAQPGVLAVNLVLTPEQISFVQDLNVELGAQKAVLPFDQCTDMTLAQEAVKLVKA